jgi:hypothetical protein
MIATTEIQRLGGVGANARYAVRRAGKRVATISRYGRSDWIMNSVHYGERLSVHRNLDGARAAAVAREHYPTADEAYEVVCRRIEAQRRALRRRELTDQMFDAIQDLAIGERDAGQSSRAVVAHDRGLRQRPA